MGSLCTLVARTASSGPVLVWDSYMALIVHKYRRMGVYETHVRMICVYVPWRYSSYYIISSTWDQNEKVLGGSQCILQTIGAVMPLNNNLLYSYMCRKNPRRSVINASMYVL